MTDDKIALSSLLEKSSDSSFLREMIGFAAERLMQLETGAICNAAPGERSADCLLPPRTRITRCLHAHLASPAPLIAEQAKQKRCSVHRRPFPRK
jgi:hypothetical protein